MNIAERIETIRKVLGLNRKDFSAKIDFPYRKLSYLLSSQTESISSELINKIVSTFDANPAWILTGGGEMFTAPAAPISDDEEGLARRLVRLRYQLDFTQAQMADRLGIQRPNLSAMENGKRGPDRDALIRLAKNCGVNLNWVMLGDGEMFSGSGEMDTAVEGFLEGFSKVASSVRQGDGPVNAEEEELLILWRQIPSRLREALLKALASQASSKSQEPVPGNPPLENEKPGSAKTTSKL